MGVGSAHTFKSYPSAFASGFLCNYWNNNIFLKVTEIGKKKYYIVGMGKKQRTDLDNKVLENRRLYVRQADRESEYDRLNEWQKKALEMSWAGVPQTEIAAGTKKSMAWVSKFLASDIVKRIKLDRARAEYMDLTPLALKTLRDIMKTSGNDAARNNAALKVLEKIELFNELEVQRKTGDTYNINLTKNENVLSMGLDQIKGLKAKLLTELEAALEAGRNKTQAGGD